LASAPVFEVRDLSYSYDDSQTALEDVDLTVCQGESLVILGANGSGKSTLLKLMDGLYFPTKGEIKVFGEPLTEARLRDDSYNYEFRRRVGLVFQDTDVQLFCASVMDEISFAPLQLGFDHDEVKRRVDAALRALRIEKLQDRAPHRLSGGEKRRVALASLLSLDPEVWLLDEPTIGLDPRSQSWLVDFILQLRNENKTVITATHDLAFAQKFATGISVFDENHHLTASGSPAEILADHDLLHRCNLAHFHVSHESSICH